MLKLPILILKLSVDFEFVSLLEEIPSISKAFKYKYLLANVRKKSILRYIFSTFIISLLHYFLKVNS